MGVSFMWRKVIAAKTTKPVWMKRLYNLYLDYSLTCFPDGAFSHSSTRAKSTTAARLTTAPTASPGAQQRSGGTVKSSQASGAIVTLPPVLGSPNPRQDLLPPGLSSLRPGSFHLLPARLISHRGSTPKCCHLLPGPGPRDPWAHPRAV